jgi:hypothetical protein
MRGVLSVLALGWDLSQTAGTPSGSVCAYRTSVKSDLRIRIPLLRPDKLLRWVSHAQAAMAWGATDGPGEPREEYEGGGQWPRLGGATRTGMRPSAALAGFSMGSG